MRVTINSDVINQLNDEYLVVPKLCLSFWCTVCISTQCSDIFVLIKKEKHTKSISLSINSWSGVIASSKSSRQFFFAGKRDRFENVHFPHVRIKGTPLPPKEKQCIISRFTTTTATILDEHEQEKREAEREWKPWPRLNGTFAIYNPSIMADYIEPRGDWILNNYIPNLPRPPVQQYAPTYKNLPASFLKGSTNFLAIVFFLPLLFLSFLSTSFIFVPTLSTNLPPFQYVLSLSLSLYLSLSIYLAISLVSSAPLPMFPWPVTGYAAISHRIQIRRAASNNKSKRTQADVVI